MEQSDSLPIMYDATQAKRKENSKKKYAMTVRWQ